MRDVVTTVLELVGLVAVAVAVAVAVWPLSPAAGLAAGGVCLIVVSWLVTWLGQRGAEDVR